VAGVMEEMKKRTIEMKFLGSYPVDAGEGAGT
jgi:hypothetical protein